MCPGTYHGYLHRATAIALPLLGSCIKPREKSSACCDKLFPGNDSDDFWPTHAVCLISNAIFTAFSNLTRSCCPS